MTEKVEQAQLLAGKYIYSRNILHGYINQFGWREGDLIPNTWDGMHVGHIAGGFHEIFGYHVFNFQMDDLDAVPDKGYRYTMSVAGQTISFIRRAGRPNVIPDIENPGQEAEILAISEALRLAFENNQIVDVEFISRVPITE